MQPDHDASPAGIVSGVLNGEASSPDGTPVAHAVLTVINAGGGQAGRGRAGPDGRFAVPGLTPGSYIVMIAAAGHEPLVRTVVVNGFGPTNLGRVVLPSAQGAEDGRRSDVTEQSTPTVSDAEQPTTPLNGTGQLSGTELSGTELSGTEVSGTELSGQAEVPQLSRPAVLSRAAQKAWTDNVADQAAALTYYGLLAILSGLVVVAAVTALLDPSATQTLTESIDALTSGPAQELLTSAVGELHQSTGLAVLLAIVGTAGLLWSATGYVAAVMRACVSVHERAGAHSAVMTWPARFLVAIAVTVLSALCAAGFVVTGPLADQVGHVLGIGSSGVLAWEIAKWPVIVLLVSVVFALLYSVAPDAGRHHLRWPTRGTLLAILVWMVASAGAIWFFVNFHVYNKAYGTLAAALVLVIWLWMSNVALLLGAEVDAQPRRTQRG